MRKTKILIVLTLVVIVSSCFLLTACYDMSNKWKEKFDISFPELSNAGTTAETANTHGWYLTLNDEFDTLDTSVWAYADHGVRRDGYWCDQPISVNNGILEIKAESHTDYECPVCPKEAMVTGGVVSRQRTGDNPQDLFAQAFGYFEAKVKFPKSGGMWSAFWLQTNTTGDITHRGENGAEIDIFESSFYHTKRTNVGHGIHYDGYGVHHKNYATIRNTGKDLYESNDGWHTFAVKWTPNEYVFYVDGVESWATNAGGICKVPAYIMLTNEILVSSPGSPYGQKLKGFDGGTFYVDYVKVYQNVNYLEHIKSANDFN